jgi:hypothetical protein
MPGRAPGPGAVPRLLERDGIGRFMDLRSFIDRGDHEPVRPVYLAILAVKSTLLAVRCSAHERKSPARPTDRTAGGRPDRLVASDRDPLVHYGWPPCGGDVLVGPGLEEPRPIAPQAPLSSARAQLESASPNFFPASLFDNFKRGAKH